MSSPPSNPTHLDPSPLGTKEYWDELYRTELENNAASATDVGTIWFEDSSAEEKVISFLYDEELALDRGSTWGEGTSFLDLGTGNGHFLLRLRRGGAEDDEDDEDDDDDDENTQSSEPFRGRMLGVDYSPDSIALAERIVAQRGYGLEQASRIEFLCWDFMASAPGEGPDAVKTGNGAGWDVVHDKGTFDAISLSGETDGQGRRIVEGYRSRVLKLLREGGLLVLTSCNWTDEEVKEWFTGQKADDSDGEQFELVKALEYRSFSFGGIKGQTVCTLCFRKVIRTDS